MIDTDKYEGHSTGWKRKINGKSYSIINDDGHKVASISDRYVNGYIDVSEFGYETWVKSDKDSQLIADAPLLLAEVKQLRKQLVAYMDFLNWVAEEHNDVWDEYEGKDEL
jgi:hypothetical protein